MIARLRNLTMRHVYFELSEFVSNVFLFIVALINAYAYALLRSVLVLHFKKSLLGGFNTHGKETYSHKTMKRHKMHKSPRTIQSTNSA